MKKAFLLIFLIKCGQKEILTAKNSSISSPTSEVRPESLIYPPLARPRTSLNFSYGISTPGGSSFLSYDVLRTNFGVTYLSCRRRYKSPKSFNLKLFDVVCFNPRSAGNLRFRTVRGNRTNLVLRLWLRPFSSSLIFFRPPPCFNAMK